MPPPLPQRDLEEVLAATRSLWLEMQNQRLFLTGGTGFFGTCLVETFLHANREMALNAQITVLTRNPEAFARKAPHLAGDKALTLFKGDVRTFSSPSGDYTYVIHAATEASAKQLAEAPQAMLSTIVDGTRHMLAFAAQAGTRKFLLTSSGGVYGRQPASLETIPEDYAGAPDPLDPVSTYGEGKRLSELLCALAARATSCEYKIARCFAFLGPHLPLDAHFAAGNFLADALAGRNISIASDGTAVRSYLYATDLAIALWTLLFKAPNLRAYNIGSDQPVTISELAHLTAAQVNPAIAVTVAKLPGENSVPHRYVPSTNRARQELNLHPTVTLAEALRRTADWHRIK